jgi:hypothetical protein
VASCKSKLWFSVMKKLCPALQNNRDCEKLTNLEKLWFTIMRQQWSQWNCEQMFTLAKLWFSRKRKLQPKTVDDAVNLKKQWFSRLWKVA